MSLFTSNSNSAVITAPEAEPEARPVSTEPKPVRAPAFTWKHILLVGLLTFCCLEVISRTYLFKISKDFSMFAKFPQHAARVTEGPGLHVALIGNSTTDDCTDARVVQAELEKTLHVPVSVDAFAAGGSMIPTQYHIMDRCFWQANRRPDLYVVTFFNNVERDQLSDSEDMDIGRLGFFFSSPRQWPQIFKNELHDPSSRLGLVAASGSATLAGRRRIADRLVSFTVPNYKRLMWDVNGENFKHILLHAGKVQAPPSTYHYLNSMIDGARSHNSDICFVAFPTRDCVDGTYPIQPEALNTMAAHNAPFIDLRHGTNMPSSYYIDAIHIDRKWAPVYSKYLANALAPLCEKIVRDRKIAAAPAAGSPSR